MQSVVWYTVLNLNNFLWLDFFTHKVIIFLNQHKISRLMVYNMTTWKFWLSKEIFCPHGRFLGDWRPPKQGQYKFLKLHDILITNQKSDLVRNDLNTKLTPASRVCNDCNDQNPRSKHDKWPIRQMTHFLHLLFELWRLVYFIYAFKDLSK